MCSCPGFLCRVGHASPAVNSGARSGPRRRGERRWARARPDPGFERGAFDEALQPDKEGKDRFIGFTGQNDPHIRKVRPVAGDGRHEGLKSTQFFDAPYHQPQHGLTREEVGGT
jgi:hypothetical protein